MAKTAAEIKAEKEAQQAAEATKAAKATETETAVPAGLKIKTTLIDPRTIQYDGNTDTTWIGDKVIESELTPFIARRLNKTLKEVK